MSERSDSSGDSINEELTAYLDGELDPLEMQRIEKRLSEDDAYRRQLQKLQQTWDLLDSIPKTNSSPSFTKSTLELVVQSAAVDLRRRRQKNWTWPVRIATLIGLPLIALSVGNLITRHFQQLPNRQLVDDLPIIENVYRYDRADSIEFLTMLEKEGVFAEDIDD